MFSNVGIKNSPKVLDANFSAYRERATLSNTNSISLSYPEVVLKA